MFLYTIYTKQLCHPLVSIHALDGILHHTPTELCLSPRLKNTLKLINDLKPSENIKLIHEHHILISYTVVVVKWLCYCCYFVIIVRE